ncbi:MAG: pyruvate synthase, partial [Candidatus Bathyarchaeia archaeon]
DPCPKGWDYHPRYSDKLGELAAKTGIFPLFEIENGVAKLNYKPPEPRLPVKEYLMKQGRFAHLAEEDIQFIQEKVDEMWEEWQVPGISPFKNGLKSS